MISQTKSFNFLHIHFSVINYLITLLTICFDEILGTRFVHTSEGRFLVTRLVPCPRCLAGVQQDNENDLQYPGRHHLAAPHFAEVH